MRKLGKNRIDAKETLEAYYCSCSCSCSSCTCYCTYPGGNQSSEMSGISSSGANSSYARDSVSYANRA